MKHLRHLALVLVLLFLAYRGELVMPDLDRAAFYLIGIVGIFFLLSSLEILLPSERVAHHLGTQTGGHGILAALFIGSTMVGGAPMVLPASRLLRKRGARPMNVTLVVGGAGVCRVSLLFFEVQFMGWMATLLRLGIALTFLLLTAYLVERWGLLS